MSATPASEIPEIRIDGEFFNEQQKIGRLTELTAEQLAESYGHEDEPGCVSCMDGRLQEHNEGRVRTAGSLIGIDGGVEKAAAILLLAGVNEVTSHDNCGAAEADYRKVHGLRDVDPVDQNAVDEHAADWSRRLAAKMGVPFRRIPKSELKGSPEFHNEAAIYVDLRGGFRTSEHLPTGFVISGSVLGGQETVAEVQKAISIACGDHGYGQRFTDEYKLPIVVLGVPDPELHNGLQNIIDQHHYPVSLIELPVGEEEAVEA